MQLYRGPNENILSQKTYAVPQAIPAGALQYLKIF